MAEVRFGMAGTGVGANFFAQAFSSLSENDRARLVAVNSRRESRAKEYASKWGLKKYYTDYGRMLEDPEIDAVIISTPHFLHYKMTIEAIKMNKHVLVDKPMAINLKEADEMIAEAERKGVKLGVNLQSRFDPVYRKIKEAVDDGRFGRLILGEALVKWYRTQEYYSSSSWRGRWATEGGGALINQAIHTIDLLLWIMGSPKMLWGQIDTVAHEIEVEDIAVATVRFENEALGVIEGSTALYPGFPHKLAIYGTDGMALAEGDTLRRWSIKGMEETVLEERKEGLQAWSRPEMLPATNHASLLKDFARAVLEDREPYVNGYEGRRSIELIMAIYRSGRTGETVKFPLKE